MMFFVLSCGDAWCRCATAVVKYGELRSYRKKKKECVCTHRLDQRLNKANIYNRISHINPTDHIEVNLLRLKQKVFWKGRCMQSCCLVMPTVFCTVGYRIGC